ncbi:MAG TPA: hypothetical protein PLE48_13645 [Thiobacillus sp.]|nr:hypothetical protein [Thiobacillus sp.]HQT71450.1 hypothetical protein [Thiobacillus sp.]
MNRADDNASIDMLRRYAVRLLPFISGALVMGFSLSSAAYTIDANLADWGLQRNGNAGDWTPHALAKAWTVEDQTGGRGAYLTPGYGGQAYDVEALYVDYDASYLYELRQRFTHGGSGSNCTNS